MDENEILENFYDRPSKRDYESELEKMVVTIALLPKARAKLRILEEKYDVSFYWKIMDYGFDKREENEKQQFIIELRRIYQKHF